MEDEGACQCPYSVTLINSVSSSLLCLSTLILPYSASDVTRSNFQRDMLLVSPSGLP